jgi:murein L,D-transpeptidase YcbB/YkuD
MPLGWAATPTLAADARAAALHQAIEARARTAAPAIAAFYAARDYAPLWTGTAGWNDRGRAALARIGRAEEDGLDPAAYRLPAAELSAQQPEAVAGAEIALSQAALAYARDAEGGRVKPSSVGPDITAEPPRPDPAKVLATLVSATDVAAALDAFNPPQEGFQALRRRLAELRADPGLDGAQPAEPRAKHGKHQRSLAQRMSREDLIATVIVNMERWRWLPRDLGATHVMVNIPEFEARVVRDGAIVHETRVIAGKATNQTPIFSAAIQYIIVNPNWNVPDSIVLKEMLPGLRKDPTFLTRQGIQVLTHVGRREVVVDPRSINWKSDDLKGLHFRQPPGERNALGHIKFMFPNDHAVYLHDTPSRSLFARDVRAFSHGCVRVQSPFELADVLLEGSGRDSRDLKAMIGGGEKRVDLPRKVPIHLAYFTARMNASGNLDVFPDIYGHDRMMESALGLNGGRIAKADEPAAKGHAPAHRGL